MANLRMGDIIAMKGSINTKNVPKGIKCPNCGALINVAASSSKKKVFYQFQSLMQQIVQNMPWE